MCSHNHTCNIMKPEQKLFWLKTLESVGPLRTKTTFKVIQLTVNVKFITAIDISQFFFDPDISLSKRRNCLQSFYIQKKCINQVLYRFKLADTNVTDFA